MLNSYNSSLAKHPRREREEHPPRNDECANALMITTFTSGK